MEPATKTLLVLNDAPYGSERTCNGARLAGALARQEGHEVKVFLIGDAAAAAHNKQKVPAELTQWTASADKALVF